MTIMADSITSNEIRIRVKMTEDNALLTSMLCIATLQAKNFTRIYVSKHRCQSFLCQKISHRIVSYNSQFNGSV